MHILLENCSSFNIWWLLTRRAESRLLNHLMCSDEMQGRMCFRLKERFTFTLAFHVDGVNLLVQVTRLSSSSLIFFLAF
jgi:hypothetical protein